MDRTQTTLTKLHWEARAYDEEGNLVILVHNPEAKAAVEELMELKRLEAKFEAQQTGTKYVEPKVNEKPMAELKTNSMFDHLMQHTLTTESCEIIWGVMPGDLRLKPVKAEEIDAERQAFRDMLREMREQSGPVDTSNAEGVGQKRKPSKNVKQLKTKIGGVKKEKVVKEKKEARVITGGIW